MERHRLALLTALAVFAVPATAQAAPVKISPKAAAVSAAGGATVEVANPNRYVLRGTATVTAGSAKAAARRSSSRSAAPAAGRPPPGAR